MKPCDKALQNVRVSCLKNHVSPWRARKCRNLLDLIKPDHRSLSSSTPRVGGEGGRRNLNNSQAGDRHENQNKKKIYEIINIFHYFKEKLNTTMCLKGQCLRIAADS